MKRIASIVLLVLLPLLTWSQDTQKITTFIVVRHAEKSKENPKDPELLPEGVERSEKLAQMLRDVNVAAIYSTNYKRTKNTVSPLASQKGLEIQTYESLIPNTIDELIKKYPAGTIVICGHSNTVPGIVNQIVGGNQYKDLDDSNFSAMFIVSVLERGKVASVTQLQY